MSTRKSQHYARAPITEAVIDLHPSFEPVPNASEIEAFARELKPAFPFQHHMKALQFALQATAGAGGEDMSLSSNTSTSGAGMRMANDRNDHIVVVRSTEFSYSHLAPYSDWDAFRDEAAQVWRQVTGRFKVRSITRTAVRYINRIVVPLGADLDIYLNLTPRLLPHVGERVEGYFMQLVLPQFDIDLECKAVVNTGIEQAAAPDSMSVLLDIDIFVNHTAGIAPDDAWSLLGRLRDRKNDIFEAAITDEVRRLIE